MKSLSVYQLLLAAELEANRSVKPNILNQLFKDNTIMTNDKQYIDQLSKDELAVIMQDVEEESYRDLTDPETGLVLNPDVAKRRVEAARKREKRIQIEKGVANRKKVAHNRATKAMQKRAKQSARRKIRK